MFKIRFGLQTLKNGLSSNPYYNSQKISFSQYIHNKKGTFVHQKFLFCWPARKDLNLRPSESESDALSSCATGRYFVLGKEKPFWSSAFDPPPLAGGAREHKKEIKT